MNIRQSNRPRSLLFVPADSDKKLAASLRSGADGLIFDLEDPIPEQGKEEAREKLSTFLANQRESIDRSVLVRVNGLASGHILKDLAAIVPHRPDAIVLPKCRGVADVHRLCDYLSAFECALLACKWEIGIVAMATESSESVFGLASYRNAPMRLTALMWGVDDLAADLGVMASQVERELSGPFSVARSMCLFAAAQANIYAIDAASTMLPNDDRVRREAVLAKRDGFEAKAAAHPAHIQAINDAFSPKEDELRWARDVVQAFSGARGAGVVRLGDEILDRPHLRLAHRILSDVHGED